MNEKKQGFTITQNEIIHAGKLSLKALGMYLFLKSKPKDWKFSTVRIKNEVQDGIASITSSIQELEKNGLVQRLKTKNSKGQFEINYQIFESFETVPEEPITGEPSRENHNGKPANGKTENGSTDNGEPDNGKPKNNKKTIPTKTEVKKINTKKDQQKIVDSSNDGELFSVEVIQPTPEARPEPAKNESDQLYKKMVDVYFEWFKGLNGVPPKFGSAEGSAMKQIINYFKIIFKESNNEGDEAEEVLKMFQFIFLNWSKLDQFTQKRTKLLNINGDLQNIITQLKNGSKKSTNKNDKSTIARTERVQSAFDKVNSMFNK